MNDIFSSLAPPSPFDALSPDPVEQLNAVVDDVAVDRQAKVAAIASVDHDDPDGLLVSYAKAYNSYKTRIANDETAQITQEIRAKKIRDEVATHSSAATSAPEYTKEISAALAARIQETANDLNPVEREAASQLGQLFGSTNPDDIAKAEDLASSTGFQDMLELQRRQFYWEKKLEDFRIPLKERSFLWAVPEALQMLLPLQDSLTRSGLVETDKTHFWDWALSGQRHNSEMSKLMSLSTSPEEFDQIAPEAARNIHKNATFFGWTNQIQEMILLSEVIHTPSPTETNLWNIVDNAPLAGLAVKGGKRVASGVKDGFKITTLLRNTRALAESRDTIITALKLNEEGGPGTAAKVLGVTDDEISGVVVFDALNPAKTFDEGVDVGADALEGLEAGKAGLQAIEGIPEDLRRLLPEEQTKAIEATVETIKNRFGKGRVKKIEIINPTEGSGIDTPVMRVHLGKADGSGGFDTLEIAKTQGRKLGLGEHPAVTFLRNPNKLSGVPRAATKAEAAELASIDAELDKLLGKIKPDVEGSAEKIAGRVNQLQKRRDSIKYQIATNEHPKNVALRSTMTSKLEALDTENTALAKKRSRLLDQQTDRNAPSDPTKRKPLAPKPQRELDEIDAKLAENEKSIQRLRDQIEGKGVDGKVVIDPQRGEAFLQFDVPVTEQGFFAPIKDVKAVWGMAGRFLFGARQLTSEDMYGLSVMSSNRRNKLASVIKKELVPKFNTLNKQDREFLNIMAMVSDEKAMWLDNAQLSQAYKIQFPASDVMPARIQDAYTAFRQINDIEYFLRNAELFNIKAGRGYQTVFFQGKMGTAFEQNATVHFDVSKARPQGRIHDITDGTTYNHVGAKKQFDAKQLEAEGKVLVTLEHPLELVDGSRVKNFVMTKEDLTMKPLKQTQLNYRAGGHRIYNPRVKYFSKQAVHGMQPDGEKYLMSPRTWIGGLTTTDVEKWTKVMNKALDVMREHKRVGLTERQINGRLTKILSEQNTLTPDEFRKAIEDKHISLDSNFETVYDRQNPSAYAATGVNLDFVNEMSGNTSYLESMGRLYYSPKGAKPIRDFANADLPVLDIFDTLNRSLMNVASTTSFSQYKVRMFEKWFATYSDILEPIPGATPSKYMAEGRYTKNASPAAVFAAEQQRSVTRRMLQWKTGADMAVESMQRYILEGVDRLASKTNSETFRHAADNLANWTLTRDPINKLRGYAFDMKLGVFNPGQLLLQTSTAFMAASIDPLRGPKAMAGYPLMRIHSVGAKTDLVGLKKMIEEIGAPIMGFDNADDMIQMLEGFRQDGWKVVNGSHSIISDYSPGSTFNLTGNKLSDVREAARWFFNEAEITNRSVAYNIAWRQTMDKRPDLPVGSQAFKERVNALTSDLSMNMDEAGSAMWQKSIAAIPFQFFAYPVKVTEAMFGKQFNWQQKMNLVVGQFLMYGAAGVPVLAYVQDKRNSARGGVPSFTDKVSPSGEAIPGQPLEAIFDRGFFDAAIFAASGGEMDTMFGNKVGVGHFWTDVVKEVFNVGRYGDKSTAEFVGGATFSIFAETGGDIKTLWDYVMAERGFGPVSQDALNQVMRNVSTWNNGLRAYQAWKYGMVTSSSGNPTGPATKAEAFAVALGVPLYEDADTAAAMDWMANRKESKKEVMDYLQQQRTLLSNNWGNPDEIIARTRAQMSILPEELVAEALAEYDSYGATDIHSGIAEAIDKQRIKDKLARQAAERAQEREKNK